MINSKVLPAIIIMTMSFCLAASSRAQSSKYNGTWVLNVEKSKFDETPTAAAVQKYKIESNHKDLVLIMTTKNENNEEVISMQKVPLDGTNSETVLLSRRTRIITANVSKDGEILTLNKSYSKSELPAEIDYCLKEVLSLNSGGKELVIELTSPGYTIKAVYDKVE